MLTADAEFRSAANAAFDAWQKQPPYIAYRVDVDIDVTGQRNTRHISRAVEARTRDDLAVLQDLPQGANQLGHSFPLPPTFDAISYFRIDFHLGDPIRQHNPLTAVTMYQTVEGQPPMPIRFSDPVASHAGVSVVAMTLRNYYATYAPDSGDRIAHILMQPLAALTRGNGSDFYLHDVYVDLETNLPTRVVYAGPTTDFAVDYSVVDDRWVITHATYRKTLVAFMHLAQTTFTVDAHYSNVSFPNPPADARLR